MRTDEKRLPDGLPLARDLADKWLKGDTKRREAYEAGAKAARQA